MKFAKIVFYAAGIWGIAVLTVLSVSTGALGRVPPPPIADPQFFFGFMSVTAAWQLAFLVIATDPVRFRLLMLPSVVEKFGYVVSMALLHAAGRVTASEASTALPDLLLGILFMVAFVRTGSRLA